MVDCAAKTPVAAAVTRPPECAPWAPPRRNGRVAYVGSALGSSDAEAAALQWGRYGAQTQSVRLLTGTDGRARDEASRGTADTAVARDSAQP
jgi:hypothetical protein